MADNKTDTDDLVERLEDSKGWPNLGKAAAARIRELEAEKKELALDVLAAQGQAADLEAENAQFRKALEGIKMTHWEDGTWKCVAKRQKQYARAALEEKSNED